MNIKPNTEKLFWGENVKMSTFRHIIQIKYEHYFWLESAAGCSLLDTLNLIYIPFLHPLIAHDRRTEEKNNS